MHGARGEVVWQGRFFPQPTLAREAVCGCAPRCSRKTHFHSDDSILDDLQTGYVGETAVARYELQPVTEGACAARHASFYPTPGETGLKQTTAQAITHVETKHREMRRQLQRRVSSAFLVKHSHGHDTEKDTRGNELEGEWAGWATRM